MKNIADSIRQRILNLARETEKDFQELIQYYAMGRFLYRLAQSKYGDRFVLKGALLMHALQIRNARSTIDIDLLGRISNDPEVIRKVIEDTIAVESEKDGLEFDKNSIVISDIRKDVDYEGRRIRFFGKLGVMRIPIQIDIGFGDAVFPQPTKVVIPAVLDLKTAEMLCYAPETSIAEKSHSILRHELLNSRMKDFYDIWLFTNALDLDEICLLKAITMTFRARKTPIDTNSIVFKEEFFRDKYKQKQWIAFLRKRHITDAPGQFSDIAREVMSFLKPYLQKTSTSE